MRFPMILAASLLLATSVFAQGCVADTGEVEGEEAALTSAKTLAKGVAYPSGLAVTGGHVYFGSNKFIASGDPDLDQQNAYWTGKFSRVPVGGGRAELVTDVGPITNVRAAGGRVYYTMSDACWITSVDPARLGTTKTVYDDADCTGEGPGTVSGFEIAGESLVIVRVDGKILKGKLDGTGMRQLAEIRVGDWGDVVDSQVVAGNNLFVLTQRGHSTNAGATIPQVLYRIALDTGRSTKVTELTSAPSHLVSDGNNVYYATEGTTVMGIAGGVGAPKVVAEGLGQIIDLAADGTNLFIADSKRGSIYVVKNAPTAPQKQKKLVAAKGIQALTASGGTVYFGTHVIENNKYAGILGSVTFQ
jgi:sugar lactone lactonase YvrE